MYFWLVVLAFRCCRSSRSACGSWIGYTPVQIQHTAQYDIIGSGNVAVYTSTKKPCRLQRPFHAQVLLLISWPFNDASYGSSCVWLTTATEALSGTTWTVGPVPAIVTFSTVWLGSCRSVIPSYSSSEPNVSSSVAVTIVGVTTVVLPCFTSALTHAWLVDMAMITNKK